MTAATNAAFALWWHTQHLAAHRLTPVQLAREAYLAGYAEAMRQRSRRLDDQIVIGEAEETHLQLALESTNG